MVLFFILFLIKFIEINRISREKLFRLAQCCLQFLHTCIFLINLKIDWQKKYVRVSEKNFNSTAIIIFVWLKSSLDETSPFI